MNKNWIPRSERWTAIERAQKKQEAENARKLRSMFWSESKSFLEKIHEEISEKVLAKRAVIE